MVMKYEYEIGICMNDEYYELQIINNHNLENV